MCEKIESITIDKFNENLEYYKKIKSASPFSKIDFITEQGNELLIDQLNIYNDSIDRYSSFEKIIEEIKDVEIAIKIEASIYEFSITYIILEKISAEYVTSIYNDKLNDILLNLNPNSILKNKILKKNILCGRIDPQIIAFLSPQQIHSEKWKTQIRKKELKEYKKNNIEATDLYECFKCHKRKCSVLQMQTRSADEPITNIVTCLNCYKVWKC